MKNKKYKMYQIDIVETGQLTRNNEYESRIKEYHKMYGIKIENDLINSKQTDNKKYKLKKKLKNENENEKLKNENKQENSDFSQNNEFYPSQTSIKSKNHAIEQFKRKTRSYSYAFQEKTGPYMYRYLSLHNYICETEEILSYKPTKKPKNDNFQNEKKKKEVKEEKLKVKKAPAKEKQLAI